MPIEYLSKDFTVDNEIAGIARVKKVLANGDKLYGISFNPSYIENIDSKIKNTINEWIANGALIKNGKSYQFEQANKTISISSELEKNITDYLSGKSFTLEEKMNPWEDGGKQPNQYTWKEFEELTAAQQIAFQNTFESEEEFEEEFIENIRR